MTFSQNFSANSVFYAVSLNTSVAEAGDPRPPRSASPLPPVAAPESCTRSGKYSCLKIPGT